MAFNKSKALENALKFLNQGKVPQAIAEYQLILRADPRDQATLMTVGDLFARQGDMPHAIEYFERLAQVYLGDGFNSKAIAIYKKIAKLAPNELAPLERLADLYVQQGVLSEARPLFLQIAEAHLKTNHAQKAVEVLHRLLDVEPENQRVQMRLAELYGMMGQKKEAAQTYLNYASRLFDRGESDEAEKLVERSLEMDATNPAALLLKARTQANANKLDAAIGTLSAHPEAGAGGEVTNLLVELEMRSGKPELAAKRARQLMAANPANYVVLYQVTDALIENGHADAALPLLAELRGPMVNHGAEENFLKSLQAACTALPGRPDALEQLVDFCRHASQPFHLTGALGQLADAYEAQGDFTRAEQALTELVDRNKNDERVLARLNQLRARAGGSPVPEVAPVEAVAEELPPAFEAPVEEAAAPSSSTSFPEETYDDETQQYIAQALTDVDLFSSYGLTQKATHLLETVLQKAPRHTPTLERLLDLYLGAGNDRRTAELASQLEQIHRERGDSVNSERFSELTRRYAKVAGISIDDLPQVPPAPSPAHVATPEAQASSVETSFEIPAAPAAEAPAFEAPAFEVAPPAPEHAPAAAEEIPAFDLAPSVAADVEHAELAAPVHAEAEAEVAPPPAPKPVSAAPPQPVALEFEVPLVSLDDEHAEPQQVAEQAAEPVAEAAAPLEAAAGSEELDLSDEWEAIASDAPTAEAEAAPAEPAHASIDDLDPVVEPESVSIDEPAAPLHAEAAPTFDEEQEPAAKFPAFHIDENMGQSDVFTDAQHSAHAEPEHAAAQQDAQPEFEIAADANSDAVSDVAGEIAAEAPAHEAQEVHAAAREEAPVEIPATVSAEELAAIFEAPLPPAAEPVAELPIVVAQTAAPEVAELEIELTPEPASAQAASGIANTDDFISELVAELEELEPPVPQEVTPARVSSSVPAQPVEQVHDQLAGVFASAGNTPAVPPSQAKPPAAAHVNGALSVSARSADAVSSVENLNQLADVFQEFRAELGEMGEEDEDLETHYNLGIAYREMGLLDEAIGEFQKVAKAVQKGKPFPYMMNCSTMLGLTFMDKGEPKVASLWYQRALETPGLEEESIMALRYDLGMALEAAGESKAALDSFRNVYAMNIDYRDVADRIAVISKR
jgi:tetratricopeptide (TPR) repeat protein